MTTTRATRANDPKGYRKMISVNDLPLIAKGKNKKGLVEYDFLADPSWEGFDSLVKYLQKYWQAKINESSDLVYSRRCVLISNGIPISVYHDSQLGNYFLREDGVDDTTLLDDIAKDLERRLSHTS